MAGYVGNSENKAKKLVQLTFVNNEQLAKKITKVFYIDDDQLAHLVHTAHTHNWTVTVEPVSDTHHQEIFTCSGCSETKVGEETPHLWDSFSSIVKTTPTAYGSASCGCSTCGKAGVNKTYVSDPHFLMKEGQKQFFVGPVTQAAPTIDGILDPGEYTWTSGEIVGLAGTNKWITLTSPVNNRTISTSDTSLSAVELFASYDNDYLYLAVKSRFLNEDATSRPTKSGAGETATILIGASDDISKNIEIVSTFYLNSNCAIDTVNVYNKDKKTIIDVQDCLLDSCARADENNVLVYEYKLDRAKMAELCETEEKLNRLFFSAKVSGINASGAINGIFWNTCSFYNANRITALGYDYEYQSGRFPHVMFLSDAPDQQTYLTNQNSTFLGNFYTVGCTETTHNTKAAQRDINYNTNYDWEAKICTYCGQILSQQTHSWDDGVEFIASTGLTKTYEYTCTSCGNKKRIVLSNTAEPTGTTTYTLMSQNILQSAIQENKKDGTYNIKPDDRYRQLYNTISKLAPDILCFEECDLGWHYILDDYEGYGTAAGLPAFNSIYTNALDGFVSDKQVVNNSIYLAKNKFNVIKAGVIRYTDSTNAYSEHPWVVTYAIVQDKVSQEHFAIAATHIISSPDGDAQVKANQIKQALGFLKQIEKDNQIPVIICGDFNADPTYEWAYGAFHEGTKWLSARERAADVIGKGYKTTNKRTKPPEATDEYGTGVIDHVFYAPGWILADEYQVMVTELAGADGTMVHTYDYSDHVGQWFEFRIGCQHEILTNITYSWNGDHTECTASGVCTSCGKVVSETSATVTTSIISNASCSSDTTYDHGVTFANSNFKNVACPSIHSIPGTAYGHSWSRYDGKAATCEEAGYTSYEECNICGGITGKITIPKLSHVLDNGTVIYAPSCSSTGEKDYCCTLCGKVITTEVLDKLPHNYSQTISAGWVTTDHYATVYKCASCSATATCHNYYDYVTGDLKETVWEYSN